MKNKILEFSKKKFITEGFNHTTMDSIASEMQISKKTIYKHFSSKQDLVEQVLNNAMFSIRDNIINITKMEKSSVEKLYILSEFVIGEIQEFSNKWIKELQIHRPDLWKKIERFREKIILQNMDSIVSQGKKEDYIVDEPNKIILAIILGSVQTVMQPDFILSNNFSVKDAGKISLKIIFNGILTPKGRRLFKKITESSKNEKK